MKIKYIYIIAIFALIFSACDDFLDVQPEGNPITSNYFTNDNQAIDAIDGLYAPVVQGRLYGQNLFWEQAAANNVVWGRSRGHNTLATLKYTGSESPLREVFETVYKNMSYANFIIDNLLDKKEEKGLSKIEHRSLGEAYFMRGWAHFLSAYRYGLKEQGVPFVRYEKLEGEYDNSIPPQLPSVIDNYKLIIEDMDNALEYLPRFEEYGADDQGRAHKAAAVAFKAKVYAYWSTWDETQWKNVITMVDMLENSYSRDLAPSLDVVFSSEFEDFWNDEYIWTLPSTGGNDGGGVSFVGSILENKGWGVYNGWGQNKPTYDIYEQMAKDGEKNDRLVRSILEYNQEFEFFGEERVFYSASDFEAGFQINKYMEPFKHKDAIEKGYVHPNGNWPTARVNFPVIRFAEMLLFRAEANLMTGQPGKAKDDLNRIRRRSNLDEITGTPTMAHLYHERRCELAFEYADHLFDLKRWHRSSNAEIKALAAKELNARPRVRKYENRSNPLSNFVIDYYDDYLDKDSYKDYMMVFPYASEQITKSNGLLKQNPGY